MSSELQLDVCCCSCCGGDIWWTLTKERQAWCYLQVKLCDPRLSALSVVATIKALYKYTSFLSFSFNLNALLPSVLRHCWLGDRKGIRPIKNMGDGGGGHWLVQMEWHPAGWSVCLPLLISPCTIKSRSSLLALANPGGPGKRAVKRLWCGSGHFLYKLQVFKF